MNVIDDLLERTCKNVITTILTCLDNATRGTVYRVGHMPELRVVRVLSGSKTEGNNNIDWGLPAVSDYNYPGKTWEEYRDDPNRPQEAMAWCVEKQESWTAENPAEDLRSVRKQLRGELEDVYHMEPVLVRKVDLYGGCLEILEYPRDRFGKPIWQDTEYVVVAVIKIHFLPNTLRVGDRSTKIVKVLSHTLGSELMSLHLRETLSQSQKEFTKKRLQSCKVLAHELRNTMSKFGFLFSAINAQASILREEWEAQLRRAFPELEWKGPILRQLNDKLRKLLAAPSNLPDTLETGKTLLSEQEELAVSSLLPSQNQQWLHNKIRPKWEKLLERPGICEEEKEEITNLLKRLENALQAGMNQELIRHVNHLPRDVRDRWANLAYVHITADKLFVVEEIIRLLDEPALPIPHKYQIKRTLKSLKVLAEALPEIEERTGKIILSLRYNSSLESEEADGYFCDPEPALLWPAQISASLGE